MSESTTKNNRIFNEIIEGIPNYFHPKPDTGEKENKKNFDEVKTWNDLAIYLQSNIVDESKLFDKYTEIMKLEEAYSPVSGSSESTRNYEDYEKYIIDKTSKQFHKNKPEESNEEPIDRPEDTSIVETSRPDSEMSDKVGRFKNIISRSGNNPAGGRQETDYNDMVMTPTVDDDEPTSGNEEARQGKGKNKLVSSLSKIVGGVRRTDDDTKTSHKVENPLMRQVQEDRKELKKFFTNPLNEPSRSGGGRSKKIIKTKSKRIKNKYSKRKHSKRKKSKHKKSKRKKSIKK